MRPGLPSLCLLSVLCLSLAATAAAPKKRRAWITIGDVAFQKIQTIAPDAMSVGSRQVRAAGVSEKVHAVVLDEHQLVAVAGAIHQHLGQCGGFMYHANEAEARAALPAPAYAIDQGEVVEPLLAGMQEKHIAATIVALSGFTNRYYACQTGVDAAHWLLGAWRELAAGRPDISVELVTHKAYQQPFVPLTIAGTDLADEKENSGGQAVHALKFARLAAAYMVELSGG